VSPPVTTEGEFCGEWSLRYDEERSFTTEHTEITENGSREPPVFGCGFASRASSKQGTHLRSAAIALSAAANSTPTAHRGGSLDDSIITQILGFFGIELQSHFSIPPG
jgi:hypothetical protein